MAVLDWFSKKKKKSGDVEPRDQRGDLAKKPQKVKTVKEKPAQKASSRTSEAEASSASSELRKPEEEKLLIGEVGGRAHKILQRPHITEKSTMLNSLGKYIFSVFPGANANEIRRAVQDVYKVHVIDVNIINLPPKRRRRGRHMYTATRNPKAVVTLKAGEAIDISV